MKIAVWHNLPSGGGKRALWDHVSGLVGHGHEVESWCPSTANQEFLPLNRICTEHVLPFKREGKLKASLGLWHLQREMDEHCQECARQIEGKGFDILFANSCAYFAAPPIARWVRGMPTVLYLGEPHREFYEAMPRLLWLTMPQEGKGFRRFRFARLLANVVRLHAMRTQALTEITNAEAFDKILVNSLYSRESILRAYGLDSSVCYLGVDASRFKSKGEPLGDYVIGLGAFGHHKGLDRAVRAVGAMRVAIRPKLIWVGNYVSGKEYTSEVESLAKSLGVDFEMKKMVKDEELISLLSRARAILYTSRLEPFGFAPLEANACGVPVVAIAEGGVRETIEHGVNGLLTADANPSNLADALEIILTNESVANQIRTKARERVLTKWGADAGIDRLEKALMDCTHGCNGNDLPDSVIGLSV